MWKSIQSGLSSVFGVDVRSLALFRIVVGIVILVDLATRAPYIETFYTDEGSFSTEICESAMPGGFWSIHLLSGSELYQQILFAIAAVAAVFLIFGCFTRTATIVTWLLLISLHVRNPLLLNSGDTLLRTMLFWSLFLPLGKVWSIDAWRRTRRMLSTDESQSTSVKWWVSGASAGLILQLLVMYWFTGIAKLNTEWLNGESLEYVLRMDMFIRPFGKWMLEFPSLLNFLSRATLWLELIGPTLLLLPWKNRYLRIAMILAFFGLHIGIVMSISVGLFSVISMTCWLPLIPSMVWDSRIAKTIGSLLFGSGKSLDETEPKTHYGSYPLTAFSVFTLLFIFAWNIQNLEQLEKSEMAVVRNSYEAVNRVMMTPWDGSELDIRNPYCLAAYGRVTMLAQEYEMFGPVPRRNHWFVYKARLEDGSSINVLDGRAATDERPLQMMHTLPDHRWRKLHRNLMIKAFEPYREPLADYFCRKWNREHGPEQQITRLEFISYVEEISPNMKKGDFEEVVLATIKLKEDETDEIVDLLDELEQNGLFPY